jgi:hypothetical protein
VITAKAPYYESRYIRANNPLRAQALWLRETLLLPRTGDPTADVWVMVFDPEGAGNTALKLSYPIKDADFRTEPWKARIAATTLDDRSATGSIDHTNWKLAIDPGDDPPVKLLTDRAYQAPFPSAKTEVRHPLARFDGSVELADRRVEVDGWTGSVNHNWGRRHTRAYAFGQVCGFDDAPASTLEIVTARAGVGPLLVPPVTLFVLRLAETEFAVRSILTARRTEGTYRPFTWSFGGNLNESFGGDPDELTLEGEIRADPGGVIGLTYTDTNGKSKYCYNSAVASCRLRLTGAAVGEVVLTAHRRAMFEILTDVRNDAVRLLA